MKEERLRQTTSLIIEQVDSDTVEDSLKRNRRDEVQNLEILVKEVHNTDGALKDHRNGDSKRPMPAIYTTVRFSNSDGSGKKWWRLLKWFPGLKSLKLAGRTTYAVPENRILENNELRKEEYSMTMWNVHEANDQRPV